MKRQSMVGAWLSVAALAVAVSGAACGDAPRTAAGGEAPTLAIAAAADLRYALDELITRFRKAHPATTVTVSYGSSGQLFAQLANGAPFDLFLSADVAYPRELGERGLTIPESDFVYAEGRVVVWVPASSALDVETLGLGTLTAKGVNRVAIANPEHAPYGRAAEAVMRSAGVFEVVRPRLVLGENVSQTLQFVQTGAADVGVVALSLATAQGDTGRYWPVPADAHPRLDQGGAIMRSAASPDEAWLFRGFMLGPDGRSVLAQYGFGPPSAVGKS